MRAQSKIRERYVVVRMTHQQLMAVHHALGFAVSGDGVGSARQGYEIIGHAARAIMNGERGDLSRAGMLYHSDGAWKEAQSAVTAERPTLEEQETP